MEVLFPNQETLRLRESKLGLLKKTVDSFLINIRRVLENNASATVLEYGVLIMFVETSEIVDNRMSTVFLPHGTLCTAIYNRNGELLALLEMSSWE